MVFFALLIFALSTSVLYGEGASLLSLVVAGGGNFSCLVPKRPVDAVTSASKWGGYGSVHAEIGIAGHVIETGLDYADLHNTIDFEESGDTGQRSLTTQSITVPVMYDFRFFERKKGEPKLIFGIGLFGSWFPSVDVQEKGYAPGYRTEVWAAGPCLRLGYYPLALQRKYFPGVYLNLFRTLNPFYSDDYYVGEKEGVFGLLDIGVSLRIKP